MEAASENQPDQVPQEVPAPEVAAPQPVPEVVPQIVVREVDEDEAARHEVRMARQVAIRHGIYLPPLPAPQFPFPQADLAPRNFGRALIDRHREYLIAQLRVENFRNRPAIPNIDYRPLSPDNSDDEPDEVMEAHQRQRRVRHQWHHYMHQRRAPLPEELVDQLLAELGRHDHRIMADLPRLIPGNNHFNNNNNNGNFRNFNGELSPSPSPSPGATPEDSEDEEPMMGGDAVMDEDVEMLNVQFDQMQPNYARARKRQNSREPVVIKKKRVTFKTDSDDEGANSDDEHEMNATFNARNGRKENEDDDEGFFGGPPHMQRNVSCA